MAEARQLLDTLIKKENFEQFEKSIEEFYKRNLIDDTQRAGFLKKNKLRKENNNVVTSIDKINNAIKKGTLTKEEIVQLKAVNDLLVQDLASEERSDVQNNKKYAALRIYTDFMNSICNDLLSPTTKNMFLRLPAPKTLNVATTLFSTLYLLGKTASFFLLEGQPKDDLIKDFTSSMQSLKKFANQLADGAKIEYGAKDYPSIAPSIKAIYDEMEKRPLGESMA